MCCDASEAGSRANVVGHLPSLFRRRVGSDIRVVRANPEDREIDLADIAKAGVVRGVSAVQHAMLGTQSGTR